MKMNLLKLSFVAITAAGLSSCGGSGGQPLTTASIPIVMGQFKTQVLNTLPTSNTVNTTLPFPGGTTNFSASVKATSCMTQTPAPADIVDADSDNLALLKTATFDCTDEPSGTKTYTQKGSYTVQDLDDTVAGILGGMQLDYAIDFYESKDSATGNVYRNSYVGSLTYTSEGAGSLTSKGESRGSYYFTGSTLGFDIDYEYASTIEWTQTPSSTAPGSEWTAGSNSISGTWSMSGTFDHEDLAGKHEQMTGQYSVKYYSKDLKYDQNAGCTGWWVSGSYFIDDNNNNILEVRYSCTKVELYLNGALSDAWTP